MKLVSKCIEENQINPRHIFFSVIITYSYGLYLSKTKVDETSQNISKFFLLVAPVN